MLFLFFGIIIGTGAIIYVSRGRKETIERMRRQQEEEQQRMKEEEDRIRQRQQSQSQSDPAQIQGRVLSGDQKLVEEFQEKIKTDPEMRERYSKFLQDKRDVWMKNLSERERKEVDEYFNKKAGEYRDSLKKAREEGKPMPTQEAPNIPIFEYLVTLCLFGFIYQIISSYMGWTTTLDILEPPPGPRHPHMHGNPPNMQEEHFGPEL